MMRRYSIVAVLLVTAAPFAGAQQKNDVVMRAMKDELARSMGQLQLQQMDKPYFVAYRVQDTTGHEISATLGSLTTARGTPSRNRIIGVELRVGDYTLDNSNFFSMRRLQSDRAGMFLNGIVQGSLDDNYEQVRREFWLATDKQYKRALEDLSAKKAAMKTRNGGESIPDFSKENPANISGELTSYNPNFDELEKLARDLSAVFRSAPEIERSSVTINFRSVITRYANSEGTSFVRSDPLLKLEVEAQTQAADGLPISDSFTVYGRNAADLQRPAGPSKDSLHARVEQMSALMVKLRSASILDRYNGPVLFEGPAAGEIFLQQFASRLAASRPLMSDNPQFETFFTQMLDRLGGTSFQDKLGGRVMPDFMTVQDAPRTDAWSGFPLLGTSAVDDDGVVTRETVLVEHGILKNLLTTRTPVRGIPQSTGSRHGWGPTPTNLFVTSEKTLSTDALHKELLSRANKRGLDYAIVIRRVGGGSAASLMEMAKQMAQQGSSTSISEIYKLYADGHEEPLRGVHIADLPVESFKELIATGDSPVVYSDELVPRMSALFSMGISSGRDLPVVACVVPSLLFEEVSLAKTEGPFPALPVSKSPLAEK